MQHSQAGEKGMTSHSAIRDDIPMCELLQQRTLPFHMRRFSVESSFHNMMW